MPQRLAYALLTLTICAAAAITGVFLASRGATGSEQISVGESGWAGFVRPPGARAPKFRLRDQDGELATMAQYRGRPVAVTFVYSTCEDTCPALVDQVRGALDDTGADVPLLAVSVDPARDTAASARRFLSERRMTGRARYLLGDERALAPVWKGYGVQPQTGELDHSATVVLVDSRGRQRVGFPHDQLTPEALAHDIDRLTRG
ncbi:MAG TPA: SCO family protein [Solirubrobacteraceae bacterium]|nr:SCO family protein [Solirubrobacteraceae bacterium]